MPPQWKQYEPNPISPHHMGLLEKLSNSRPGDYNAPFNEALKEKQAIEAQQLNQQSVQLTLDAKQRAAAQEKAQAEAIAAEFGNMDPNAPIDMVKVWDAVQRNALKHNDIKTATDIERVRREKENGADAPLSASQRLLFEQQIGRPLPPETTLRDLNTLGAFERTKVASNRAATYDKQVEENKARRQQIIQSYAPGGFEADTDPVTGQGPNKEDGKKFTATAVAHSELHGLLNDLEDSLQISSGNDPSDPEFQNQKQIIGQMLVAINKKNNFGATLSPNELRMNNSALPQIFANPVTGVGQSLVNMQLGRDPFDAINNLRRMLEQDFEGQRVLYKFRRKGSTLGMPYGGGAGGDSQAMPEIGGLSRSLPELAGVPSPTPTGPPAPQAQSDRTPEEIAYKEQHLAKLRAQAGQ